MTAKYQCILADPPWEQPRVGRYKVAKHKRPDDLPYNTMTSDEICSLEVGKLAMPGCHLWLWTTNAHLQTAFDVIDAWGFKYLTCITWVKPSGMGAWFVSRTQHLLFAYRSPLKMLQRYKPTVVFANPLKHSEKPAEFTALVEAVSPGSRLEMFARRPLPGWDVWGNEVQSDVQIVGMAAR